jgi:hypothetical protein
MINVLVAASREKDQLNLSKNLKILILKPLVNIWALISIRKGKKDKNLQVDCCSPKI